MRLRMHENSLFAILLRARWWVSMLVAAGLFAAARLAVPEIYAAFVALPFAAIGFIAGWRQFRVTDCGGTAQRAVPRAAARNAPCPCGSGRKYKRCCGATS